MSINTINSINAKIAKYTKVAKTKFKVIVLVSILVLTVFWWASTQKQDLKFRSFSKHGSPFFSEINTEILDFDSGKMRLTVELGSFVEFENIQYKWIIPKGVELKWGSETGQIVQLLSSKYEKIEIEVASLDLSTNQNIILFIERNEGLNKLGSSFVIASRKELTEEYAKQAQTQMESYSFSESKVNKKKYIY